MATFQAVYVRIPSLDGVPGERFAQHLRGTAEARVQAPWVELEVLSLQDMDVLGRAVSELCDVDAVAVQIQTGASVFGLWTFSGGEQTRLLTYSDGRWLQAEGMRQPWEAAAFFSEEQREDALADADEEEHSTVRQVFAARNIEPGSFYPSPSFLEFLPALGVDKAWWELLRKRPVAGRIQGQRGLLGAVRSLFKRRGWEHLAS